MDRDIALMINENELNVLHNSLYQYLKDKASSSVRHFNSDTFESIKADYIRRYTDDLNLFYNICAMANSIMTFFNLMTVIDSIIRKNLETTE